MGWAEERIEEYRQGKEATWWEKKSLEHANPVHYVLMIPGVVAIIYGLWAHSWIWIIIGMGLNFLGHLYCWIKK